ncbi:MAG: radical SAM protein [Lachnospiraceae bacterium]|nr:radical SAM protein [Lachnospiraceae bacterium]
MIISKALKVIPEILSVELTTKCNLDCSYCNRKSEMTDISSKLVDKIIEQASSFKKLVICGVGESFLYPYIYDFVSKFLYQKICIVTNGTIIIDFDKLNKLNNIERLVFSLDAVNGDKIKKICSNYNFDNLLINLASYKRYETSSNKKIALVLNCTLSEYNLSELVKLVDFAVKFEFGAIHFSLPRGNEKFIEENQIEIVNELANAKKRAIANNIHFVNPFEPCCVYLKWITPYLSIDGYVYACSETLYKNNILCDLNVASFGEIWKMQKYEEFSTGLLCKDCRFLLNSQMDFNSFEQECK